MGAIRSVIVTALLVLAFISTPFSNPEAGAQKVPVLERSEDGHLVWRGTFGEAPRQFAGRQRILPFDSFSLKGLIGRKSRRPRLRGISAPEVDTVRVMLLRVSFEDDWLDDYSSMTEGGDFDLAQTGGAVIDPPPHDSYYFDSHMLALRNYFRFQSCERLWIEWDIFPEGRDDSYKLSDIADYGPGQREVWTTGRLVRFFRDCCLAADEDFAAGGYQVRFADYDALIIAHAGAPLQTDINFDTPNDIPSFFARLGDEDRFTVDGGATEIVDGSVIPEAATQDGLNAGIAAILAHEFSHQLGLPDLYDINTNSPTVGVWDNMDSGGSLAAYIKDENGKRHYVQGVIPAGLSAWPRTLLGWTVVDTIRTFRNSIFLPAVEKSPARTVRVEVSSDEYFLLENRASEIDGDSTHFVVDTTGVIIGTGSAPDGELTGEYDFLLPTEDGATIAVDGGPGILIWHVDDRLIAERWETNEVNSIYPFGISLVEAGGVVDLGDPTSGYQFGWWDDAYFEGNNSTFSDSTLPPSWSNWNVPSGVRVERITGRDTLMGFGAGVRDLIATEPIGAPAAHGDLETLPLPGYLGSLLISRDGTGWLAGRSDPVFSLQQSVFGPPAVARNYDSGRNGIVLLERRGVIHLFIEDEWPNEFPGWPFAMDDSSATNPAVASLGPEGELIVSADNGGRIYVIGNGDVGSWRSTFLVPGRVLGNLVVTSDTAGVADGIFSLWREFDDGGDIWLTRFTFVRVGGGSVGLKLSPEEDNSCKLKLSGEDLRGKLALIGGDIDPAGSGYEVFVVALGTGRIILCGRSGVLMDKITGGRIVAPPALHDLNGDGCLDLIYSDGTSVHAVNPYGANLTGWPRKLKDMYHLPWGIDIKAPITTVEAPGGPYVVAATRSGLVYTFDRKGDLAGGSPRRISSSHDRAVEIVLSGNESAFAYMDGGRFKWRRSGLGRVDERYSWNSIYGDRARTAFKHPSRRGAEYMATLADAAENFKVYPNPSHGDRVRFHFPAPTAGEASLEVMTITGELVVKMSKILNGGEEEFVIPMGGRASGVYLCRLVVTSGGRNIEAYRKFAIVH